MMKMLKRFYQNYRAFILTFCALYAGFAQGRCGGVPLDSNPLILVPAVILSLLGLLVLHDIVISDINRKENQ